MSAPYLIALLVAGAMTLAGCNHTMQEGKIRSYNGLEVTHIIVDKSDRNLRLYHHDRVLKSFPVHLGSNPRGHKEFMGDGRTPEGWYRIDRKNSNSSFHLSLGISYPDPLDTQRARARGRSPGGDIFIHGKPNDGRTVGRDWTAGCIAVTNGQIETIYSMVEINTPILIRA
ncbi:MAG: L,D-transpeptidase family protein [Rhodobacteraceae bacterium]|nr:L,D-transpeptidase family protein [Paracoccaceae bacterium]